MDNDGFWERESQLKSVAPGRSAVHQPMVPHPGVLRQLNLELMGYFLNRTQSVGVGSRVDLGGIHW